MSRRLRSDNLRAAPRWITPDIVRRVIELAMPVEQKTVPVVQVPTRGVKPQLAIVSSQDSLSPVTHSRRAEESEAAFNGPTPAASPRRPFNPAPSNAAELAAGREVYIQRRKERAAAQIEADRPAFEIAYRRGISIADLARALGQKEGTISLHTRQAGFRFGRREQLADPLTREQLMALADPAIPLPELRSVRLRRERLEKWNAYKRDKRADDVARRRSERLAASEQRRREREEAREEARRRREAERAARKAAKAPPKKKICEVEKVSVCRPVNPAPSREPALPAAKQAPAQPVIIRTTPGAPRWANYAERINAAITFLRGRNFTVQRHSREEIIARWRVSGWNGLFSNEQLVQLAEHYGLQVQA